MKSQRFLTFLLFIPFFVFSQKKQIEVSFVPVFEGNSIELDKNYAIENGSVEVSTFKFYISNIQFLKDRKLVEQFQKKHFLLDLEKPETLKMIDPKKKNLDFDAISFEIGIDEKTNISGAMGEDLDPTTGMYWTWQSGYINFKMEGKIIDSGKKSQNFEYHIGGYEKPFQTLQKVNLKTKNSNTISINIDLSKYFENPVIKKINKVMSPGENAVFFAKLFADSFKITAK